MRDYRSRKRWTLTRWGWDLCATVHPPREWFTFTGWDVDIRRGLIWIDLVAVVLSAVRAER